MPFTAPQSDSPRQADPIHTGPAAPTAAPDASPSLLQQIWNPTPATAPVLGQAVGDVATNAAAGLGAGLTAPIRAGAQMLGVDTSQWGASDMRKRIEAGGIAEGAGEAAGAVLPWLYGGGELGALAKVPGLVRAAGSGALGGLLTPVPGGEKMTPGQLATAKAEQAGTGLATGLGLGGVGHWLAGKAAKYLPQTVEEFNVERLKGIMDRIGMGHEAPTTAGTDALHKVEVAVTDKLAAANARLQVPVDGAFIGLDSGKRSLEASLTSDATRNELQSIWDREIEPLRSKGMLSGQELADAVTHLNNEARHIADDAHMSGDSRNLWKLTYGLRDISEHLENSATPIDPADVNAIADRKIARDAYREWSTAAEGTTPTSGGVFSPGGMLKAQSRRQGKQRFAHEPIDPADKERLTAINDLLTRGQRDPGFFWDLLGYGAGHAISGPLAGIGGAAGAHAARRAWPSVIRGTRRGLARAGEAGPGTQTAITGAGGALAGQATPEVLSPTDQPPYRSITP